jgi:site-specific recombinase XerD
MKVIRRKANLPRNLVLYCCRHGFATTAVCDGVDIATLAKLMGHRRIETTNWYVTLTGKDDHLNDAVVHAFKGNPFAAKTADAATPVES